MTDALPAAAARAADRAGARTALVGQDDGHPVHMAYDEAGDPAWPVHVLLLHGLFDHRGTWRAVTPHLTGAGFHVVAPDLIGFGDSSRPAFAATPPDERYGVDAQVGFLRALLRQLPVDEWILAGNSLGGGLALRSLCTPWPDGPRVRGLVLEDAAGYNQALPGYIRALADWPGRLLLNRGIFALALRAGLVRAIARATFREVFYDRRKIPQDLVDRAVDILRAPGALRAYREAARNLIPGDIATFPERYRDIRIPTLVLWGRDDRIVPALFGLLFEAEIPGARLHVFAECGHAPHLEYPVETGVAIRDWIRHKVLV